MMALFALPLVASAQPDPNNAPKGNNPTNRAVGGGRGGRGQNFTPEQIKTFVSQNIKPQLEAAKVTGETEQNALTTYITDELVARQKLATATRALQIGLRNPATTDAQIAGLLNEYQAAVADEKTRHQTALDTLKEGIDISQFPRLEATLTLMGLYGDAPAAMGGGGGMMGMMGGFGGQNANIGGARGNMNNRRGQTVVPF